MTRRVVNDRPSRTRSTWYTMGTPGRPGRRKYACSECTGRSESVVRPHGDEGLARHLSAEDPLQGLLRAAATEDVDLDLLQVEQIDEPFRWIRHVSRSPVLTTGRRR